MDENIPFDKNENGEENIPAPENIPEEESAADVAAEEIPEVQPEPVCITEENDAVCAENPLPDETPSEPSDFQPNPFEDTLTIPAQKQPETASPANSYEEFRQNYQGGCTPQQPSYAQFIQQAQYSSAQKPQNQFAGAQNLIYGGAVQSYTDIQQPAPRKEKYTPPLTGGQKKIIWLLRICAIVLVLIFLYCIISDVVLFGTGGRHSSGSVSSERTSDSSSSSSSSDIYRESKSDYYDAEKYTVEEIAEMVSPSIVQVMAVSEDSGSGGSGIILTEDGYILTNSHVVYGFDDIGVSVQGDDTTYTAELVGHDSKSDLAVLKIDAKNLLPAVIGYASELRVGEEVVAIGNPGGLTGSVTRGIVSAVDRQVRAGSTGFYMDCIQTDAAISSGSSGGALVNMYGQVVGVTSSKRAAGAASDSVYEGLGFAISIDQALPIANEIIDNGYVGGRVRVGITLSPLSDPTVQTQFAANFGLTESPCKKGIWIVKIDPDCDIAKTELSVNDVIVAVENTPVNSYDDLCSVIEDKKAGDELTASCIRYSPDENGSVKSRKFTIKFRLMEDKSGNY